MHPCDREICSNIVINNRICRVEFNVQPFSLIPRSFPPAHKHYTRIIIYPPKSGKVWLILCCNDDVTWTWFGLTWSWFGLFGYRALPAHAYALARTVPIFVESAVLSVHANVYAWAGSALCPGSPNHDQVRTNHVQVTSSLQHKINQTFPLFGE